MKKRKMLFRRICVLALVFCMVLTLLPTALAAVEMPQWAIDAGLTEEEYLELIEKEKEKEESIPVQPPQPFPAVEETVPETPAAEIETPVVETPYVETPYVEMPYVETPYAEEGFAAENSFGEEFLTEEVFFAEENSEEGFIEEVPADEVFFEEEPVEDAFFEEEPVEDTFFEEEAIEEAPVEEVPAEETPVEEVLAEETPVEEAPTEETPVEEAPVEEAPAEEEAVTPEAEITEEEDKGYTVEFHGENGEEYVLQGDSTAPLADVLSIIGHGDIDLSQVEDIVSSDSSLFSAEKDENGSWIVKANSEFATNQSMMLKMADGSTVEIFVTDASPVAKFKGHLFESLQDALDAAANFGGGVVRLLQDVDNSNIVLNTAVDIVVDFAGHTYNVAKKLSNELDTKIAAVFSGTGSVTLKNGTLSTDNLKIETVVESSVNELTIKDMLIKGLDTVKEAVLSIVGGNVKIEGNTSIDAGRHWKTAIEIDDSKKDTNVLVNTLGVILGKVVARDIDRTHRKDTDVLLHNGYFSGEVIAYPGADVEVDGGNYLTDVNRYVDKNTDYAAVSNPYGTIYSAGRNLSQTALKSAMRSPTYINVLKSDGSVLLPLNAAVKNSVRDKHFIFLNGRPMLRGGWKPVSISMIRPMFRPMFKALACTVPVVSASVVDCANSIWHKGCKEGLCYELSDEISYVTVDGVKINADIDGVYAQLDAKAFEALKAGTHTVRFVLKNGAVAATSLKVVPNEKIVWTKGSRNGLNFEMTGKIAKVLIDHVKVEAEIDGKDASVSASVLQDLKAGNHTFEFVLENSSHVVTGITVK